MAPVEETSRHSQWYIASRPVGRGRDEWPVGHGERPGGRRARRVTARARVGPCRGQRAHALGHRVTGVDVTPSSSRRRVCGRATWFTPTWWICRRVLGLQQVRSR